MLQLSRAILGSLVRGSLGLVAMLASPALAFAQTNIGTLASGMNTEATGVGNLIVTGAFLGGIGLGAYSLNTIRVAHKSEGRDAKMSHGGIGLVIAAGLVALPSVLGISVSSVFEGGTGTAPTEQSINVQ